MKELFVEDNPPGSRSTVSLSHTLKSRQNLMNFGRHVISADTTSLQDKALPIINTQLQAMMYDSADGGG